MVLGWEEGEISGVIRRARTRGKALELAHDLSIARGGAPLLVLVRSASPGYPVTYIVVELDQLARFKQLGYRRLARVQSLLPVRNSIVIRSVSE